MLANSDTAFSSAAARVPARNMYLGTGYASLAAAGILHHPPGAGATPLALISSERRCCFLRGSTARSTPEERSASSFWSLHQSVRKCSPKQVCLYQIELRVSQFENGVSPVRLAIIAEQWRSRWRLMPRNHRFAWGRKLQSKLIRGSGAELGAARTPSMSSVGARLGGRRSRYQVYDPIVLVVQVAQECGHHSCRPRLRIVQ